VNSEKSPVKYQELHTGHVFVIIGPLGEVADDSVDIHVPDFFTEDVTFSFGRVDDAKKHLNGSRLTGPVRAQKTENLALFHDEIQIVDDFNFTREPSSIGLREFSSFYGGGQ